MGTAFDNIPKAGQQQRGDPAVESLADGVVNVLFDTHGSSTSDEKAHRLNLMFGDAPIPDAVIEAARNLYEEPATKSAIVGNLAKYRGAEMLPWLEKLLPSTALAESAPAALGLLYIDEDRALELLERMYIEGRERVRDTSGYELRWIQDELNELGTENSLALAERLRAYDLRFAQS